MKFILRQKDEGEKKFSIQKSLFELCPGGAYHLLFPFALSENFGNKMNDNFIWLLHRTQRFLLPQTYFSDTKLAFICMSWHKIQIDLLKNTFLNTSCFDLFLVAYLIQHKDLLTFSIFEIISLAYGLNKFIFERVVGYLDDSWQIFLVD